ncbi:hypothetical protein SAY87_023189 [Trapa incisa]|uniref:DUF599 domain-containing protein n=1 Tax=Trapa incisa TaxID=236973 RepID=A0AAN7K914_9MYRT|nr:hypothetical protein SAY87_023189 [Trapa incisa]
MILVPLGFMISLGYHAWLWHKVKTQPLSTIIGTNSTARRFWVSAIIKVQSGLQWHLNLSCIVRSESVISSSLVKYKLQDNEKKNIIAIQTIRNTIMGGTLMATTSIMICCGLAAVISSTYSIKKPISDSIYGAHGELTLALKYITLLTVFLFSFLCYSLSIRFLNQVNILINTPVNDPANPATPDYISDLLEKGFTVNTIGNRLFYVGLPILLWISGPLLVFLCSIVIVLILYNLDFVALSQVDPKMWMDMEMGSD